MELEKVNLSVPEGNLVPISGYDCIWIYYKSRNEALPIENRAVQWIDWRLQGQVSRFLASKGQTRPGATFVATMNRLDAAFVALESGDAPDWDSFWRNCEGLKLKSVLLLCENEAWATNVESLIGRRTGAFPERVCLGMEHA